MNIRWAGVLWVKTRVGKLSNRDIPDGQKGHS